MSVIAEPERGRIHLSRRGPGRYIRRVVPFAIDTHSTGNTHGVEIDGVPTDLELLRSLIGVH